MNIRFCFGFRYSDFGFGSAQTGLECGSCLADKLELGIDMASLLDSFRVLDLTDEKGFFCGKILADLGADVVKIEKPGGDPATTNRTSL